jgi:hypothetical protein
LRIEIIFTVLFTAAFAGCSFDSIGKPNLLHPGSLDEQRARMERFDPFGSVIPNAHIDNTERPPGFDMPAPQPKRYDGYSKKETGFP